MSADARGRLDEREVAPDVYRFGSDRVNWYVVAGDEGVTVVDSGLPAHFDQLEPGLERLGYGLDDVAALLLTHGHPDHVGFAERLRTRGVEVWAHDADRSLLENGGGTPPRDLLLNLWRPALVRYFVSSLRSGATSIEPVGAATSLDDGATLDVPGSPRVRHVPGHSPGNCAFVFDDRDAVCVGDALVTVDFRTFEPSEPRLSLINADRDRALSSLSRLESLDVGEVTMLPGHGDPWRGHLAEAVDAARSLS
jgi:glyoxylase-like metal-dependent hydrolase (beta-lactamase superfamily II)